eukprot:5852268-Pyramimonas_sp.AAC.1
MRAKVRPKEGRTYPAPSLQREPKPVLGLIRQKLACRAPVQIGDALQRSVDGVHYVCKHTGKCAVSPKDVLDVA